MSRWRALAAALCLSAGAAAAGPIRIATYNAELTRDGPGLLLADLLDGDDAQIAATVRVIAELNPDILHLTGFDWDLEGHALAAFADLLAEAGAPYPHRLSARPNSGLPSGADLDGNGRRGEARDAQGYGRFTGQSGMAILSRYPLGALRDFSALLWRDLPGNSVPVIDGAPFPSPEAAAVRRLSSVGHWDVPVQIGARIVHLLAWHGSTPAFDGPEDLNGARGADEALFWLLLLDGALPASPPPRPVIVLGIANIDPEDGDGRHAAIRRLLSDSRLQDPAPTGSGGAAAANAAHRGDPGRDTADFGDPAPGNLRVDYLLPDAGLKVLDTGVFWPAPGNPMADPVARASRHRMVWVDIDLP